MTERARSGVSVVATGAGPASRYQPSSSRRCSVGSYRPSGLLRAPRPLRRPVSGVDTVLDGYDACESHDPNLRYPLDACRLTEFYPSRRGICRTVRDHSDADPVAHAHRTGVVSLIQRSGSALFLHIRFQILILHGHFSHSREWGQGIALSGGSSVRPSAYSGARSRPGSVSHQRPE